jgi:hypothetical protein
VVFGNTTTTSAQTLIMFAGLGLLALFAFSGKRK